MKKSALQLLFCFMLLGLLNACTQHEFEALKVEAAVESTDNSDTEEEVDDESTPIKHQIITRHEQFDDDAPDLTAYRQLPLYTVGSGTARSCDDTALRKAITDVNTKGEGRIEFDCGDRFHRIVLVSALVINPEVRILISGRLDAEGKKPLLALDGRNANQLFNLDPGSDVVFEKLLFYDGESDVRQDGGAIYASNETIEGSLILSECVFKANLARNNDGGAIYAERLQRFTAYRTVFEKNSGDSGGALYLNETLFDIIDCYFVENEVGTVGGAIFLQNKITPADATYLLKGNRFEINQADNGGSSINAQLGENIELQIAHCEFERNQVRTDNGGDAGGALCVLNGKLTLQSSSFLANDSIDSVAGIYIKSDGGFFAENCTFYGNTTGDNAQVATIHQEDDSPSIIKNCTFSNNRGGLVGAIYRTDAQHLQIISSLFADNFKEPFISGTCNNTFVDGSENGASNLQYESSAPSPDATDCTDGIHKGDPQIYTPQKNGGVVSTCRIANDSSARNIGTSCATIDARGINRNGNTNCDAGAYEVNDED